MSQNLSSAAVVIGALRVQVFCKAATDVYHPCCIFQMPLTAVYGFVLILFAILQAGTSTDGQNHCSYKKLLVPDNACDSALEAANQRDQEDPKMFMYPRQTGEVVAISYLPVNPALCSCACRKKNAYPGTKQLCMRCGLCCYACHISSHRMSHPLYAKLCHLCNFKSTTSPAQRATPEIVQ